MDDAAQPPGPLRPGQDREDLVAEVAAALQPLPRHGSVLVAASGGPDSTALSHLAAEARPDIALSLGHVRHGLRDDEEDVAVVRQHARFLGAGVEIATVEVEPDGQGLEAAARDQRYAALRRLARGVGAGWILLGHTADDQAETLLLRLARGTGVEGLGGMPQVRGDLVRPLLRIRRSDIHRFVAEEGLTTVADPMNEDPSLMRVRARQEVLPAFERLGPDPVGALARLADLARADARLLSTQAARVDESVTWEVGPVSVLAWVDLMGLPPPLASRLIRRLVMRSRGDDHPPTAAQVSDVLTLSQGAVAELPGVTATRGGGWLAMGPSDLGAPPPAELAVPGVLPWPDLDLAIEAATGEGEEAAGGQLAMPVSGAPPPPVPVAPGVLPPGARAALGAVLIAAPEDPPPGALTVRTRAPGDRVSLEVGTRKLQDVLVDAGVPRLLRDLLPVVCHRDRIVWVPGLALDAELAVQPGRQAWASLRMARPER